MNWAYTYFQFTSDGEFMVIFGIAIIIVLALSNACLSGVSCLIQIYSGKRFYSISMRLLEKYLRQPYVFFLNVNTAELAKSILTEVETCVRVFVLVLQLISNCVISLSIVALLIFINPVLAVITAAAFGLAYSIVFFFVRKVLAKKGMEKSVQNSLKYKYVNETFGGIKDIKILGKEKTFLDFFSSPARRFAMAESVSEIIHEVPKYVLETVAFSFILALVIFLISRGSSINDFLPVITVYAFGAYRLLPTLQKIFRAVANVKFNFPILENLHRYFYELPAGEPLNPEDSSLMKFSEEIFLENIVFRYPNTERDVINKQSLKIKVNNSIALVGATGCGKTTFVDVILGLLVPQEGKIFVDSVEIGDGNRKNWQKNIGYVPQAIYLTDDSIRNNIAFGIEPRKVDDDAVVKAAKLANIHDFIVHELNNGYDTIVGERGIRLSGGQKQRIGIARAVYHDPSVLVLDEATSALDGLTENAIMDAIRNLTHKITIIIIAHRLTTIKHCDVIYLMEKGEIIDSGTYGELYQKNETFRKTADGI